MKGKIVHGPKYNRAQILIKDPLFQRLMARIRKDFVDLGCPLPKGGFSTNEEFTSWKDKYFKLREKRSKKTSFYEISFREILIENDINPNDKFYKEFLREHLFFGQHEPKTTPLEIKATFNKKTKKEELYVQIFSHTTLKDIEGAWKAIEKEKRQVFAGEKTRSAKWHRKDADIQIYNLSEQMKKVSLRERKEKYGDGRIEEIIRKKMGSERLTYESIRRSIAKVKSYKNVTGRKPSRS
jgi:hypothetical protein